jgi:hypothetical protein
MHKYDLVYLLLSAMKNSTHSLVCRSLCNHVLILCSAHCISVHGSLPQVPSNTGQILNNIIGRFAPANKDELFTEIFGERESRLLVEMATNPESLCTFTAAVSLLIDIVWNTREMVSDDPNGELGADLPPPPFIQTHILDNLGKFVACLRHDWTSPREMRGAGMPPLPVPPHLLGKSVGNFRIKGLSVLLLSSAASSLFWSLFCLSLHSDRAAVDAGAERVWGSSGRGVPAHRRLRRVC